MRENLEHPQEKINVKFRISGKSSHFIIVNHTKKEKVQKDKRTNNDLFKNYTEN